jgi:hypothetical protein
VFVTERHPVDRLLSYFVKGRSARLRRSFDAAAGRFGDRDAIAREFLDWSWAQVDRQRKWYRNKLLRPFGLDVMQAEPVDGLLVGGSGPNALIVVPTAGLNALRETAATAFGTDCYRWLSDNSAREGGDDVIDAAFRREVEVDPAVAEALWAIPEVARIHGKPTPLRSG